MDELFDRIRSTKIKRKYLVASLIFTELVGILFLIWFLKTPLTQKFLLSAPKAYSLSTFQSNKRYVLNQQDFLTGTINPKDKIIIVVRQGKSKIRLDRQKISTNDKGDWLYQVPQTLPPGLYTLLSGIEHPDKTITSAKSYQIRLASNELLKQNVITRSLFAKPAVFFEDLETQSNNASPIFYFNLSYNPSNDSIAVIGSGKTDEELQPLSPNKPKLPSSFLLIKVDILSKKGILESGWKPISKQASKSPDGTYNFRIYTDKPDSIITLYLDDKLIWSNK